MSVKTVACAKGGYYARCMRPSRSFPALAAMDARIDRSLASIGEAAATERRAPERAARALRQARLPVSLGGGGCTAHSKICAAEWTASVANTAKRVIVLVYMAMVTGKALTDEQKIGAAVAIGGVLLYSVIDDLFSKKKSKTK